MMLGQSALPPDPTSDRNVTAVTVASTNASLCSRSR